MICTGQVSGTEPVTCSGDSGGPLLCKDDFTGSWVAQGIVSYGSLYACSETAKNQRLHAVYTRVSAFLDWIQQTITIGSGQSNHMALSLPEKFRKKKKPVIFTNGTA